ncbi:hypothetical protein [Hippea sp. KM1]|uniref:hypothetical protein n=1 Tax=Hippea sp. KM1 TaxID=944481 RepID=UPI00046D531C|nr:hypothetical protein [Hippea sp. KM1]
MIVIEKGAKVFKVDDELFDDVKEFLHDLAKKRNKSFSYFDELGDLIVVKGNEEFVIPMDEDVKAISEAEREDFLDEEEVKKILDV